MIVLDTPALVWPSTTYGPGAKSSGRPLWSPASGHRDRFGTGRGAPFGRDSPSRTVLCSLRVRVPTDGRRLPCRLGRPLPDCHSATLVRRARNRRWRDLGVLRRRTCTDCRCGSIGERRPSRHSPRAATSTSSATSSSASSWPPAPPVGERPSCPARVTTSVTPTAGVADVFPDVQAIGPPWRGYGGWSSRNSRR